MAAVLLQRFEHEQKTAENPMGLSQFRDAALASQFPTRQAQDAWLDVAVGPNRKYVDAALVHSRRAIRLCPLQGEAYAYLAELSFLEGPGAAPKEALIAQALKVRPFEGIVLLAAGKEAALTGELSQSLQAIAYWKLAFRQDPEVQESGRGGCRPAAAGMVHPARIPLGCGRAANAVLLLSYAQRPEETRLAGQQYVKELVKQANASDSRTVAASQWHEAQAVCTDLGYLEQAVACQRRAVELAPSDYQKRKNLRILAASLRALRRGHFGTAVVPAPTTGRCTSQRHAVPGKPRTAGIQVRYDEHRVRPVAASATAPR